MMKARALLSSLLGRNYLLSVGAGYMQVAVTMAVSLLQVPLFLAYLGKEQFGIWALALQASTWLQLLDGGMNGAVARHLIDYRTDLDGGRLASCLATGMKVMAFQGILVFAIAAGIGTLGGSLFGLSAPEYEPFRCVMTVLGISGLTGFMAKIPQAWLYASQRLDIANLIGLLLAPLELAIAWFLLRQGDGIMSVAWARLAISLATLALCWWICVRWLNLPWRKALKGGDMDMFRKLAVFGGGMFLLTLGALLLSMTQTAMTAVHLGVAAAAIWATAPKALLLAQQLVCRLWDYRIPHLSALMAGKNSRRLSSEFSRIFRITAWAGAGICGVIAALNPAFLEVWTSGTIGWDWRNNAIMAVSVHAFLMLRCFTDFVLHTKKVGWMPALMCAEGLCFVAAAALLLPRFGFPGMLLAGMLSNGMLRLPYAWRQFRLYLGEDAPSAASILGVALWASLFGAAAGGAVFLCGHLVHAHGALITLFSQSLLATLILCLLLLFLSRSWRAAAPSLPENLPQMP